jgi:hypothetical protein
MATEQELDEIRRQWDSISQGPGSEDYKDGLRTAYALNVGNFLVKNGVHTKDQFESCFLELLGPDAKGYARLSYCTAMAKNGREKQIEFWGTEEERIAYEASKAANPTSSSKGGCAAMLCVLILGPILLLAVL